MLYLSQLLKRKVYDSADNVIGRLSDIYIAPKQGEYSPLEFLQIKRAGKKEMVFIPYEYVETLSPSDISIRALTNKIPFEKNIPEGFLSLSNYVLDQQIVDISGARVVRANDLRLGNFDSKMCVLAIDISTRGLLRRLGIEWFGFFDFLKVNLIDWRETQPVHGMLKLDTISEKLNKLHPADLANIVEDLNMKHSSRLVKSLDAKSAATVLEELDPGLQKILIKYWGPEQSSKILSQMPVEEIVDLMKMLPKAEARLFLSRLKETKLKKIENLIIYPDDTAGGLMTVDFVSVKPSWTIGRAITEIKKSLPSTRSILYVYVADEDGNFCGIVSLRWLLVSPTKKKISKLLKTPATHSVLHPEDKVEKIIEIMTRYDLFTAAVVDENNKLIGVVTIDEVMRHLFPHA